MSEKRTRRKRSHMTIEQANKAVVDIASKIERFAETSAASAFQKGQRKDVALDEVNIQILVKGNFGVADGFFEALRIFKGEKLPANSSK